MLQWQQGQKVISRRRQTQVGACRERERVKNVFRFALSLSFYQHFCFGRTRARREKDECIRNAKNFGNHYFCRRTRLYDDLRYDFKSIGLILCSIYIYIYIFEDERTCLLRIHSNIFNVDKKGEKSIQQVDHEICKWSQRKRPRIEYPALTRCLRWNVSSEKLSIWHSPSERKCVCCSSHLIEVTTGIPPRSLSPSNIEKWVLLSMCSFYARNKKKTERSNTSSNIRKGLCIIDDNKAMANVHIWSVHLRRRTSVWNVIVNHEEICSWSPRPETKDNRRRMSIDWLLFLTLHR